MDEQDPTELAQLIERANELMCAHEKAQCEDFLVSMLETHPEAAELWSIRAMNHFIHGELDACLPHAERAAELDPDDPRLNVNLAELYTLLGREDEAMAAYQKAMNIDPRQEQAYLGLGNLLRQRGDIDGALANFARASTFAPHSPAALNNYAALLFECDNINEAATYSERVLKIEPDHIVARRRLGMIYRNQGRGEEAIDNNLAGLEHHPDDVFLLHETAKLFDFSKLPGQALRHYRRAIELAPTRIDIRNNLSKALHDIGEVGEAREHLQHIIDQGEDQRTAWSNLLVLSHYTCETTAEQLTELHRSYGAEFGSEGSPPYDFTKRSTEPERVLKVGFVSPDLHNHPVGYFLLPLFNHFDQSRAQFVTYSTRDIRDGTTEALEPRIDTWRDVASHSDKELADQIYQDEIDLLIDLAGHTSTNRLSLFAMKPAPIQATGFGYFNTTGIPAMDYIIGDRYQSPISLAHLYTEAIYQMPDDYICYQAPPNTPPVGPLPALDQGHITFGSFNKLAKLSDKTLTLWAEVLHAVAGSKLLMRTHGLGDPQVCDSLAERFGALGITPERLELLSGCSHGDLLNTYNRVDIALDSYPYSGGLTTCEALWMGVPVVTIGEKRFASLHSTSHLSNAGLPQLIASDFEHYVTIAKELANNIPELREMRSNLRANTAASPLCDGPRYANSFHTFIRDVWRRYCEQRAAE